MDFKLSFALINVVPYLPFTEVPDTDVYILLSVLYLMKFIKSCTSIKFIKWHMWY